jgi:Fe-S cluster biogenesis protein NfuA
MFEDVKKIIDEEIRPFLVTEGGRYRTIECGEWRCKGDIQRNVRWLPHA